ncbi:2'-5' RNA ligase [Oikeobacillus pervagus]|uniref:Putative phosphoesterase J2S13_002053 n=1 Tax=Oikeobacillus pervagus TaxID=1325931 RepID=A0AAJ1SZA7_9BACI|nr:YjcG family protein [Oikeobacillus pervagus]MDQ0215635.1 2'-5' RNA ligase [Oikeobacillus pervagus]
MKYGIVAFPSKKLQDLANSYRKRYDPHYSLIPPHLTLKAPFEADENQLNEIVIKLQKISKSNKPFPLHVYKVSSFEPVNNVIYFKAEINEDLQKIYQDLHEFGDQPPYSFVPHITIAQKLSHSEYSDVFNSLRMVGIEHQEEIDRFHLLYQLDNESWTVYETFRLGKE